MNITSIRNLVLISILLTLMSASCDCFDGENERDIYFKIESDSTDNEAYKSSDIDSITVVKLRKDSNEKLDSAFYFSSFSASDLTYLFKDTIAFTNFDYLILIKDSTYFHIRQFIIEGKENDGGCYESTKQSVIVNDQYYNKTSKEGDGWFDQQITLNKSMSKKL